MFRAIAGFGASGEVRADDVLRLNVDLPIVIEFFDEPKVVEAAIALLLASSLGPTLSLGPHSVMPLARCLRSGLERFRVWDANKGLALRRAPTRRISVSNAVAFSSIESFRLRGGDLFEKRF